MSAPLAQRRRLSPGLGQLALRGGVVVGVALALAAAGAAGARPPGWVPVVLVALSLLVAARPDSVAGVAVLVGPAYVWMSGARTHDPLVLLAAAGLVGAHVCALVAAQGPLLVRPDPAQVRRWGSRGVLLWLSAAVVWVLARVLDGVGGGRWVYAAGLVALTGVAVLATRAVTRRR